MRVPCFTAAAIVASAAIPAAAQQPAAATTVQEFVVMAPVDRDGPNRASQVVAYHDLDLRTRGGQQQLEWRVEMAAKEVCRELDRRSTASAPLTGGSCEREAVRRAKPQVRGAIDLAFHRHAYSALTRVPTPLDTVD